MSELGLRDYYEQELRYLRDAGNEFGEAHSDIAGRLRLKGGVTDDPHVERLLQGFAFLAARVHRRIDDDFSQICQSLLTLIYPHYLRPIPSLSIVQFEPDKGAPTTGLKIPAGASLISPPAAGVRCRFRSCYDTEVWPLRVADAVWQSARGSEGGRGKDVTAVLRVRLETTDGQDLSELPLKSLRFYLDGDLPMVSELFELLDNSCSGVLVRDPLRSEAAEPIHGGRPRPIGFDVSEGLLPSPGRSFHGYQLLLEYFAFPRKFFFLEVGGLDALGHHCSGDAAELLFQIRSFPGPERQEMLERSVSTRTIRLGCSPIVNLFEVEERLRLDERKTEHLLRDQLPEEYPFRIFSIDEMVAINKDTATRVAMSPYLSHRRLLQTSETGLFWHERRHASGWMGSDKTDLSLAFVDLSGEVIKPRYPTVVASLQVFNGRLPNDLIHVTQSSSREDLLELEGGGAPLERIAVLERPTLPIEPTLEGSFLWRLISQLSLNYLSLVEHDGQALRELLRLYNFGKSETGEEHVRGIEAVRSEPCYARVRNEHGVSFARGKRVHIEFDQERFPTGGLYLFASVLERFLALYVTINSFSALTAHVRATDQRYTLREWPPRTGDRTLL